MKNLFLFLLVMSFSNCMSSLHQFNQADVVNIQEYSTVKKIEADSEQFAFLGFVYETNYVEKGIEELLSKCKNGSVEQIGTTFKTKLGFLSWTNQIHLVGYCLEKK
jgi:hypothetical protein